MFMMLGRQRFQEIRTKGFGVTLTFWIHIWRELGSNFGQNTEYPDQSFQFFFLSPARKVPEQYLD
jgi:hypothetical protein